MNALSAQRCFHHMGREAVARCPECTRYYCRECITEHEGRVICAACLKQLSARDLPRIRRESYLASLGLAALGLCVAAIFFFWVGRGLLAIPPAFHNGTIWEEGVGAP